MNKNTYGFSMIEILIGIFIFTLGLVSIYSLILSTMNLNEYSKNSIIATNLARESIELVRNVRDNNYKNLFKWNKFPGNDVTKFFSTGVYYTVENNFSVSDIENVDIHQIPHFIEGEDHLNDMDNFMLCINANKNYTYDCSSGNQKTYFYRYLRFDDVTYNSGGTMEVLADAVKITSKVIWYKKGYHEIELKTILTDYLRQ